MDFIFSSEQDELRSTVRAMLAKAASAGVMREAVDQADGTTPQSTRDLWQQMRDLGWHAVLIPEEAGGLGLTLVDAVVVLEELGRVAAPGPYVSSAIAATVAARELGLTDLLQSLADGSTTATVALEEAGHGDPVGQVRTRAIRKGAKWHLHGVKPLVLDADIADVVIVAARTQDGIGSFLLRNPEITPVPTLDPSRSAGRLEFDGVVGELVGPLGDHHSIWRTIADAAAVALAAELVGVTESSLEMATAYADERVQFDAPLSSHQVIKHKLVDMLHALELGRVGVHYAAWAADTNDPDAGRAAAIAKSSMAEAAIAVTGDNIQIHGAVGFTWESDAHVLFKRAKQNDLMFGYQGWQRERVADSILPARV